ncbi:MAG: hypothetical protein O2U61_04200 [Candidatus Bathyarchaeota archaeon]|nr:hypothetical protein [Candidatus Bathyarchaeota archaeon]
MPERVKAEIIIPLIKTPKDINGKDTLNGIPIIKEAAAPVQLPVRGKGKAVKETKPIFPYFVMPGKILFLVLEKIQRKNFLNILNLFDKKRDVGPNRNKSPATEKVFPIKEIKNVFQRGIVDVKPTGIDTFNSSIGVIASIKTLSSEDINQNYLMNFSPPKYPWRALGIFIELSLC